MFPRNANSLKTGHRNKPHLLTMLLFPKTDQAKEGFFPGTSLNVSPLSILLFKTNFKCNTPGYLTTKLQNGVAEKPTLHIMG